MNQDTAKTNKTPQLEETTINLRVRTGLMHSNKREEAHTRNDYTSFYIGAINYFIRIALEAQSLLDMQTDSQAFRNDVQFRENLQFMVQLSEAFSEWLPGYSHAIADGNDTKQEATRVNSAYKGTSGESLKPSDTAKQVSDLLNNPDLPEPIKDGLADGLLDLFNSHINQSEFHDYEKSPEYVEKILRGYAARHSAE